MKYLSKEEIKKRTIIALQNELSDPSLKRRDGYKSALKDISEKKISFGRKIKKKNPQKYCGLVQLSRICVVCGAIVTTKGSELGHYKLWCELCGTIYYDEVD